MNKLSVIFVAVNLLVGLAKTCAANELANLADQLQNLAELHGIEIRGLDRTEGLPTKQADGRLVDRIKQLLSDFNYTIVQAPGEPIERIIIVGPKRHRPRRTILHTVRHGKNHVIQGVITSHTGYSEQVSLVVDTGADYIVLPKSMMGALGLDADSTVVRELQTANGVIKADIGRLAKLQIGNEIIQNVEAAFIDGAQLGGAKLLGMNVLRRYRFTLDDKRQTITLIKAE